MPRPSEHFLLWKNTEMSSVCCETSAGPFWKGHLSLCALPRCRGVTAMDEVLITFVTGHWIIFERRSVQSRERQSAVKTNLTLMMKKWKENKERSRNTQWFSGDDDSLFTPDQCSVPEEGDEGSCPSRAAAGGTSTVKHLRGDYLLRVGIWATSAFLWVNKALSNAGKQIIQVSLPSQKQPMHLI